MRMFLLSIFTLFMLATTPASAIDLSCEGIWGTSTLINCPAEALGITPRDQHSGDHDNGGSNGSNGSNGGGGGGGSGGGGGGGGGEGGGKPGHGHGDKNHEHSGPPGQNK